MDIDTGKLGQSEFSRERHPPLTLPDKWIGHSVMHKAIRRGHYELAARGALALLRVDAAGVWKRLLTIAFEDVGIGNLEAVQLAARLCCSSEARKTFGGHEAAASHLASLLAASPKDRSADHLILAARYHPSLEVARQRCGSLPLDARFPLINEAGSALPERSVAAWYASGVDWYPEKRVGQGDLGQLMMTYLQMGASPGLVDATAQAVKRVREPIVLMLPLVVLEASSVSRPPDEAPEAFEEVYGIPLFALDRFTRIGKRAFGQLIKESASTRSALEKVGPDSRWLSLLGLAVFYVEGGIVHRPVSWAGSDDVSPLGCFSEFAALGAFGRPVTDLIASTRSGLPHLNAIRRKLLEQMMQETSS